MNKFNDCWAREHNRQIVSLIPGLVLVFRGKHSGKIVSADRNIENVPLIANRDQAQTWEEFLVCPQDDGSFALRAMANGKYIAVNHENRLHADSDNINPCTLFDAFWTDRTNREIVLRSQSTGLFVSIDENSGNCCVASRNGDPALANSWEVLSFEASSTDPAMDRICKNWLDAQQLAMELHQSN